MPFTANVNQIVIFGEVLFDCFPDGNKVLGGAPFNVAWHLQAFGADPLFISRVGEDENGLEIIAAMDSWGMCREGLQVDHQHPTGTVQISFNGQEPCYEIVTDCAYDYIDFRSLPDFQQHSVIYHGTLAFRHSVSLACLQSLQQKTAKRFVDVNLRAPWWNKDSVLNWLQGAHWIKLNGEELNLLPGLKDRVNEHSADQVMFVTHGASGARVITRLQNRFLPITTDPAKVIDTVGAGDAFSSVMLLGILHDWPIELSLNRAQQFAAGIVGIQGAIRSDKGFYQSFIERWRL